MGSLGPEDTERYKFVQQCRALSLEGRLSAVWFGVTNEFGGPYRKAWGGKVNALGRIKGAPDLVFLWNNGGGCLEFKSTKGTLNDHQILFKQWCGHQSVHYEIARSSKEAMDILKGWGVLNDRM